MCMCRAARTLGTNPTAHPCELLLCLPQNLKWDSIWILSGI